MAVYLLACLTPYVPATRVPIMSLLGLAFPYIFLGALACALVFFFIKKSTACIMLAVIFLAGYKNISNSVALRPAAWQMQKKPGTLRIMTWNVEDFLNFYALTDPRAAPRLSIEQTITRYSPDVICFQEYCSIEGKDFISVKKEITALGYPYSFLSNDSVVTFPGSPDIAYVGSAIFSRSPIFDTERINIRNTVRYESVIHADAAFGDKRMRIFTGHLASLNLYVDTVDAPAGENNIYEVTYHSKRKIASRFKAGEVIHEGEVAIIKKHLNASPYPAIYCGDDNTVPTSYTYNYLKGDMQDAFLEKGSGIGRTFFELSPTLRIDVCFVDKAMKIEQCTTPPLHYSDHFPIITDISWK